MAYVKKNLADAPIGLYLRRLALPLGLANILQQFYNIVDILLVGCYAGEQAFAAIGVAGTVMNLFLFAIIGACSGIAVIFSQAYGAKDTAKFRQEHALALTAGCLLTLLLAVCGELFLHSILQLLQTPLELQADAASYLQLIFLSLPAAYVYNFYCALLRSAGHAREPLLVLVLAVVINLCLDIIFIDTYNLGAYGAGLATLLAQFVSAGAAAALTYNHHRAMFFHRADFQPNMVLLKQTGRFASVTGFHQAGLYLGKICVQGVVNTAGTTAIAAYTAALCLEGFINAIGDGGAAATAVVTGQQIGAKNPTGVSKTFWESLRLLIISGVLLSILLYLLTEPAATFLLDDTAAQNEAISYLHIVACFYILCFTGNTFAGYFDGIGKVSIPFIGAVTHITLRVIISSLLIADLGLASVALATGCGWLYVNILWGGLYRCRYNITSMEWYQRKEHLYEN